jgi:glycosyltransferase involved in cell wall biosynthesis
MKISIITAVFNRTDSIAEALRSVQAQSWHDVEHVVVDGASTDGTLFVLQNFLNVSTRSGYQAQWTSEPDLGIYYALNKGLARATGDVIGLMHSDDFFADHEVLTSVATAFADPAVDAVFGDLDYVDKSNTTYIVRRWRAGRYSAAKLSLGWMPPHPTLFLRRRVIERWGGFDTNFSISADYDSILRYFGQGKIQSAYIPRVLVKMRLGGESNRSLGRIWLKTREDYTALRRNGVGGLGALIWKNVSKIGQFF